MKYSTKRLKIKQCRQNNKKDINKQLNDYKNSINDVYIQHFTNMLFNIYDCTGWNPTTLNGYIKCANYENNMKNNEIWYIPDIKYFREYLNIKLI